MKPMIQLAITANVLAALLGCGGATSGGSLLDGEFENAEIRALNEVEKPDLSDTDADTEIISCRVDEDNDGFGAGSRIEFEVPVGDDCRDLNLPDDWSSNNDDCDDGDRDINPDAKELCNKVDDDCDGRIDEGCSGDEETEEIGCYVDEDNDGFGAGSRIEFEVPVGDDCRDLNLPDDWSSNNDDCDDEASQVNPGEDEVCNEVDDDCDGDIDEDDSELSPGECDDTESISCYVDNDRDGFGAGSRRTLTVPQGDTCEDAGDYTDDNDDCDDGDEDINPDAQEDCNNGIDDDCDGDEDEDDSDCAAGEEPEFCKVKISFNGDSSVRGTGSSYSSYYAEIYALAFDGGDVVNDDYWPSDRDDDWSNNDPDDSGFDQVLSVTNGSSATGTIQNVDGAFDSILVQGGVWRNSSGGGFIRWVTGNYSDVVAGEITGEYSCDGDSTWRSMNCVTEDNGNNGYDSRCWR